jgi:multiple sugar transport system permease protein
MKSKPKFLKSVTRVFLYGFLFLLAFSMLTPFIWMILTSFMSELEIFSYPPKILPHKLLWSNYIEALTLLPFDRFFLNTIIVTLFAVAGQLITCSMAGYAFARLHFKGRDKIFAVYLSTMMIPAIVTLIPSYLIINAFGWMDTYWAIFTPLLTWTIYWRVILPLSKPALGTLAIFAFMASWKDFLWPLIVTSRNDMRTVEVGIAMFHSLHSTNWQYQMAAAVVVMLPIALIFFFTQKYFIKGITLSGLKE